MMWKSVKWHLKSNIKPLLLLRLKMWHYHAYFISPSSPLAANDALFIFIERTKLLRKISRISIWTFSKSRNVIFLGLLRHIQGVWKSQKKSHSTLRAKRATFTFWADKSWLKMPKMLNFGEFLQTWSLRSNSVTRQVSFNTTKIAGKCQNSNATFWVIFKQCADPE